MHRMAQMTWLGFYLLTAALALGSATHSASAQGVPGQYTPAAADLKSDEQDMLARARAEMERNRRGSPVEATTSDDAPGDAVRDQAIQAEVDRRIREAER